MTRLAQHLAGGATAHQGGVVDTVPPASIDWTRSAACAQDGGAGLLAQLDQLIGGLLDAQPLARGAASSSPALAIAWVSATQLSSWSGVWQDAIENAPS